MATIFQDAEVMATIFGNALTDRRVEDGPIDQLALVVHAHLHSRHQSAINHHHNHAINRRRYQYPQSRRNQPAITPRSYRNLAAFISQLNRDHAAITQSAPCPWDPWREHLRERLLMATSLNQRTLTVGPGDTPMATS